MFTKQDAINRVLVARTGSLVPENITLEYLETLSRHVKQWDQYIQEKIYLLQKKEAREDRRLKEYILIHVKADGPVSMRSIIAWLEDQWPGEVNHLKVNKAVGELHEAEEIEPYDEDGSTWW